ncbi:MAG: HAD-IA family hydrolase [Bryobacteraceae bacterium]
METGIEASSPESLAAAELLIFDLDGTLIDSQRDLVESVNATRGHMGMAPLETAVIASYVGNGAPVLIARSLGAEAGEREVARGLEYFLGYYREHMLDHTDLYPGVREALDRLREAGRAMAVLTNKPVRFSQEIVEGLGLTGHFLRVYGGNSFEHKKPHPVGIERLMAEAGSAASRTVMVGDSAVDIRTARAAGVFACGVTFGFQPETFVDAPPDLLVDDLRDLARWVIG